MILYKIILFPLSLLYAGIMWIRNMLYRLQILPEQPFDFPVINVGNLSTGGTGKTPHVEYLIRLLTPHFQAATLSRGYGRKSLGYLLADENSTAETIGDEPLQFYKKFHDLVVCVCEKRLLAIPLILYDRPYVQVLIMDDAFQHRSVKPGLNILLTTYEAPFYTDLILPSGNLREWPSAYHRAHVIIVTKCPPGLDKAGRDAIVQRIHPLPHQQVYFTTIQYGVPVHAFTGETLTETNAKKALVFSGIANAHPFEAHCDAIFKTCIHKTFGDHHRFDDTDMDDLIHRFQQIPENGIMVCTEKDRMRLMHTSQEDKIRSIPLYYIPIEVKFLGDEDAFRSTIMHFVHSYDEPESRGE